MQSPEDPHQLNDADPMPPREPAFNLPGIVVACCLVLLGIHALRIALSASTDDAILATFAFVPARMAIALGLAQQGLQTAVQHIPQETFVALIGDGSGRWWSLFTYALLHGSWAHVGFNCVWLAAFGAPVARRFGSLRFLLLLAVSAIFGALAQFAATPASFAPVIGASAGVAGAMGAATRFVFRNPNDPVHRVARGDLAAAYRRPALSLAQVFRTRGALFFVLFWFASNVIFGLFPALTRLGDEPIAWQAHIGGFLTGLLLFPMFDPRQPAATRDYDIEDSAELPLEEPR